MDKNELIKKLIDVFQELRSASMNIVDDPRPIMEKYNMLFLGGKFNKITSIELYLALSSYFGITMESSVFHEMIPSICNMLSMKYEAAVNVQTPNQLHKYYLIELW